MKKEWQKYKVGKPSKKENWDNRDCVSFRKVSHIAHINKAINIISDSKIKSSLVFDKSKLKLERILVNWFSPNEWYNGSRYGNISFDISLKKLIKGKNIYWVEAIKNKIDACRILNTENKYSKYQIYDPFLGDGPWWYDKENNKSYYNNNYCLEFMIEADFVINNNTKIKFVDHSTKYCSETNNNPNACSEFKMSRMKASKVFLSKIIASDINVDKYLYASSKNPSKPSGELLYAWAYYVGIFNKYKSYFNGKLTSKERDSKAMSRAIFNAYGNQCEDEVKALVSYFKNIDELLITSAKLVSKKFGFLDWEIFMNEVS